jgi:hypothetical protein
MPRGYKTVLPFPPISRILPERNLANLPKMTLKSHHGEKRLDHTPSNAYDRLLVVYKDIAPGHEIE